MNVSSSHHLQNGHLTHPQDIDALLRIASQRKINSYRQQYADSQNISLLPAIVAPPHAYTANFCIFFFYRATGRSRRNSLPQECHRNTTRHVLFSPRCLESEFEERSQPDSRRQKRRLCRSTSIWTERRLSRSRTPNARSFTRSSSSPHPPFTQYPFPPRSLVRDSEVGHVPLDVRND
jgi:hypothetical protein